MRAFRFEALKLLAQNRARLILGVALLAPFVFAVAIRSQQSLPKDTLFGRQLRESGFATPLVTLGFAGSWAFPLLASLVAGTILASEDHHRTWSLLLTRTVSRGRIFLGKLGVSVVFALLVVLTLAAASTLAGVLVIGAPAAHRSRRQPDRGGPRARPGGCGVGLRDPAGAGLHRAQPAGVGRHPVHGRGAHREPPGL